MKSPSRFVIIIGKQPAPSRARANGKTQRGEPMEQKENTENKQAKENKRKTWISWIVWVIVILILSRTMGGQQKVSVSVNTDGLAFRTDSGYTSELKWDEVASLELQETLPDGTLVEGTDTRKEKSGIWTNDTFGEYELIVNAKVTNCIVCRTTSGRVMVFNFESEESTKSLLTAMEEKLAQT